MKNIIAAIFKNESGGYQMITELRKTPSTQQAVIAQMVLVKRENGTFNVCDRFDGISQNAEGTIAGGLIGAVVGLLGGPLGVLLMGATGALAGSMVDLSGSTYGEAMLETVATKMMDGEVALIILAEENDEAFLDALLGKFDAMILRYDAVDVADEVEEAAAMQKEMARQARQQLRESKREERKQKNEEKREAKEAEMEADFEEYKKNLGAE